MFDLRVAICVFGCFLWSVSSNAFAAAPHALADLLRPAEIHSVVLAPDGKHFAYASRKPGSPADTIVVSPVDPTQDGAITRQFVFARSGNQTRVVRLRWIGSRRLIAEVTDEFREQLQRVTTGSQSRLRILHRGRLHGLDVSGGVVIALDPRLDWVDIVDDSMAESGKLLVAANDGGRYSLQELSLDDGQLTLVMDGGPNTCCWRAFDGRPVFKMDYLPYRGLRNVFVAGTDEEDGWKMVGTHDTRTGIWLKQHFVAYGPRPTEVYVLARRNDSDTTGVHLFDLARNAFVSTQAEVAGRDIVSALVIHDRFVAAGYVDDQLRQVFADAAQGEHYARLEDAVGTDDSIEVLDMDDAGSRWLLRISGPHRPPEYFAYDVDRRHLQLLVSERPWLDGERLAAVVPRRFRTRDGATLDAYVTCHETQDASRAPLLVMPPAGPWTRSSLQFNPAAQALAAQGWCVLEPNYRGVSGYGESFRESGFGKWSGEVANDIVDAIEDSISAGIGSGDRIAFLATELGAYATLAGAIEHPDLFRAGATMAAVVDLETLVNGLRMVYWRHSPIVENWKEYQGNESRRTSPLVRADELSCPILLIHVDGVEEVPILQSRAMEKALRKAGRRVSTMWLPDDKTWDVAAANEAASLTRTIEFLASHVAVKFQEPGKTSSVSPTPQSHVRAPAASLPQATPVQTPPAAPADDISAQPPSPAAENANCIQPSVVDREACYGRLRLEMSKDEIFILLGRPDGTSRDGTNLRYGDRYLIFNSADKLIRISDRPI